MSTYITNNDLCDTIVKVVAGNGLRWLVGQQTKGVARILAAAGVEPSSAALLVDICSEEANVADLCDLAAPLNLNLKLMQGVNTGMVASENGIILGAFAHDQVAAALDGSERKSIGVGVFETFESKVSQDVVRWFDNLFLQSAAIDKGMLSALRSLSLRLISKKHYQKTSMIQFIFDHPELFDRVGFVVTWKLMTEKERSLARQAAAIELAEQEEVESFPTDGILAGFKTEEVLQWPASFIEFVSVRTLVQVRFRRLRASAPAAGVVFSVHDAALSRHLSASGCPNFTMRQDESLEVIRFLKSQSRRIFFGVDEFISATASVASHLKPSRSDE